MEVGLREASQRFSRIIKAVRAGTEVWLTDRGKLLARIVPVRQVDPAEEAVRRLEDRGLLRAAANPAPMPAWRPRPLRGAPIAETLRAERDAS